MEIKRGTLVIVDGTRIGVVTGITRPPGMTMYDIIYQDSGILPDAVRDIFPLWQTTNEDIDALNESNSADHFFAKYTALIAVDLHTKIDNLRRALAAIGIAPQQQWQ
jgi:hypothetical protein